MIVDCHVHMRGDPIRKGGLLKSAQADLDTPEAVLALMDEAGVHRAIVFPTFALHPDNEGLARAVNARPERFIGFAWLNPHDGELAIQELERLVLDHGFRGLKLHPLLHAFRANDEAVVGDLVQQAGEMDVPVLVHSGHAPFSLPWQVADLARRHPSAVVIMAHMGGQFTYLDDAIDLAATIPNLYLDTTNVVMHHKIRDAVARAGADKVLFGSDAPHIHPKVQMEAIRCAKLAPAEEELVLGENARRLTGT